MTAVCRTLLCAMCLAFAGGVGETFPAVLRAAEPEWIWASDSPAAKEVAQFRKQFRVGGPVKSATLGVAGDDEVAVFLNGQPVVRRHGSWREPMFVGVSEQLKSGDNVLAVRGANQSSAAAVVLQLEIELADGQRQSVVTDATWRSSKSAGRGWQEAGYDDAQWPAAHSFGKVGVAPWGKLSLDIASQPKPVATLPERFALAPGFRVELLYSVPGTEQGSWVSLAVDPRGRLIVSDQAGALYRVEVGPTPAHTKVERLRVGIGQAHGLLYAFDSLYVTVNGNAAQGSGLYRVRDTDGDDQFDSVQLLRRIEGGGEHGPHAVVLGPDGQSLYVAGGNHTKLPQPERSLVPRNWQEDQLLPRMWDAGGHAVGILAPGGWICRTDPEGREWELVSSGYRNEYDIAFNPSGDLFTYDSDMEWDIGSPWYRPTRVCHATSGSEFGWRSGSGKWPEYYADSLPAAVDIGPGSPTG
ncbi:MAG: heme-binding protein, partial [Pirellulaceae bacterium]